MGNDNDKGTVIYLVEMLKDDDDVVSMFLWMVIFIFEFVRIASAQIVSIDLVSCCRVFSYLM
jgi:hypothetical protein